MYSSLPELRQHLQLDRLDLVRLRADAREADGELLVVGVHDADAGRLDEEAELVRRRRWRERSAWSPPAEEGEALLIPRIVSSSSPEASRAGSSIPSPSRCAAWIVTSLLKWPVSGTRRLTNASGCRGCSAICPVDRLVVGDRW